MAGKAAGVVKRTAIFLMLLIAALWLALMSVVVGQWIGAGTQLWAVNFDAANGAEGARVHADATRVMQLWNQRLAQALLAGPVALVLTALISRVRWLIWLCFGLVIVATVSAMYVR